MKGWSTFVVVLILTSSAIAQGSEWPGLDVAGNVYCDRHGTLWPGGNILVVDIQREKITSVSSFDDGAFRLLYAREQVSRILGQAFSLRFWVGTRKEERTWHLAPQPTNTVNGRPTVVIAGQKLSAKCEAVDLNAEQAAEAQLTRSLNSLALLNEAATPVDPFGAWAVSPQVGWAREWFRPAFLWDTALGTRLTAGASFGQYQTPGPFTKGGPKQGQGMLPFQGGFGQVDMEWHLARAATVQYVISLGLRMGMSHRQNMIQDADKPVWGPVLSTRAVWPWGPRVAGIVQAHLSCSSPLSRRTP